jgi:hypothetical protein
MARSFHILDKTQARRGSTIDYGSGLDLVAQKRGDTGGDEENEDQGILELFEEQGQGRDGSSRLQFVRAEEAQPPGGLGTAETCRRTRQTLTESVDGRAWGTCRIRFASGMAVWAGK